MHNYVNTYFDEVKTLFILPYLFTNSYQENN